MMEKIKNKNILITGGAGFIGSNLANILCKSNYVVVLDNLLSGRIQNLTKNVKFIHNSTDNILKINFDVIFDYVFHFGEYSRVELSTNEFLKCFENSAASIGHVIEFCTLHKCKLIYAGSSTKFSPQGQFLSPYTYCKAQNVNFVNHFCSVFQIPYAIVYFSNVYGNNELDEGPYATVVGKFLKSKISNQPVEVTSPGTQARAFTHIEDTISGIILAALYGDGDGYVIGSSKSYSIIEICRMLELEYSIVPEHPSNRLESVFDTSKISALGWREYFSLEVYLEEELKNFLKGK